MITRTVKQFGKVIAICKISSIVIASSLQIALIIFNAPLIYFALALALEPACFLLFLVGSSTKIYFHIDLNKISIKPVKELLSQSWPYLVSAILITICMKVDQIMIKEILGNEEAGQYAVAARLSEAWYFIPMTIVASVYPSILNAKSRSETEYQRRILSLYSLMFYMALSISLLIGFFSEIVIALLLGSEFEQSAGILNIYIWASIFVFWGVSNTKWLLTEGFHKYYAMNIFIGALSNIVLNYLVIPKYGVNSAAWTTLFSQSLSAYFCLLIWKNTRSNFKALTKSMFTLPKL